MISDKGSIVMRLGFDEALLLVDKDSGFGFVRNRFEYINCGFICRTFFSFAYGFNSSWLSEPLSVEMLNHS